MGSKALAVRSRNPSSTDISLDISSSSGSLVHFFRLS